MTAPGLLYADQVQLLRAACELLRLPQPVLATALTFLHRYHKACPSQDHSRQIAPACLFLASKVEESQVRVNDLINSFLYLDSPSDPEEVHAIFPGLAHCAAADSSAAHPIAAAIPDPQGAAAAEGGKSAEQQVSPPPPLPQPRQPAKLLVGDAYYTAKDRLIQHEQLLLRWLGFELSVDQPYRYLLNCANAAGCSSATVAAALCLANDSLMYTSMSAERQPVEVAAGVLLLAAILQDDQQRVSLLLYIEGMGVTRNRAEQVGEQLLAALEHAASRHPGY